MPSKPHKPRYCLHRSTGQARCWIAGREIYLGPYGTPESYAAYERALAEWQATGMVHRAGDPLTVNQMVAAFFRHAKVHYRKPDGTDGAEVGAFVQSLKPLQELYGGTLAKDFGPLGLKAVRQRMLECGWCRKVINQRINRCRRVFKWAASEQLVSHAVFLSLTTVQGLLRGRSKAIDHPEVAPAPMADVIRTLRRLNSTVRAMVRVQYYTGMRPGEVCRLRPSEIDQSGDVWVYRPAEHKTAWQGHKKVVVIGPRAQRVLRPFLDREPEAFLFSPAEAMERVWEERRRNRRTPLTPSQRTRKRKRQPKRSPGPCYTIASYGRAIRQACLAAAVGHWHPHQLRHNAASRIEHAFGLDAARAVLGHRDAQVTTIYAARDLKTAAEVARKLG